MKESEVIRAAIPHLENGWCRNLLTDHLGSVCARGAVNKVMTGSASIFPTPRRSTQEEMALHHRVELALNAKATELSSVALGSHLPIVFYNNCVAEDAQDVINLFEKTAAGLEEQGR